jgi:hypothetical protein
MRNKNITAVYAWQVKEGLCHWAESSLASLDVTKPPSPEAKMLKCILMTYSEYLKLRRPKKK